MSTMRGMFPTCFFGFLIWVSMWSITKGVLISEEAIPTVLKGRELVRDEGMCISLDSKRL